ncbi:MAG TPA: hypothetical protein VHD60_01945 [Candidatus Saccharimonadales bacterium]|nr:hypothetical protein [Candidatus Saccharimonadales bacterium]
MKDGAEAIPFPVSRRLNREAINADLEIIGVDFQTVSEAATSAWHDVLGRLALYTDNPALLSYLDDFLVQSAPTAKVIPANAHPFTEPVFEAAPTGIIVEYSRDIGADTLSTIRAHTLIPTTSILHFHELMADALRPRNIDEGLITRLALTWTFYNAAAQALVGIASAASRAEDTGIGYEEWIGKLRSAFPGTQDVYNNPPADDAELRRYYETQKSSRLVFGMGIDMLMNTPTRSADIIAEIRKAVSLIVRSHQELLRQRGENNIMSSPYLLAASTPASRDTIQEFFAAAARHWL